MTTFLGSYQRARRSRPGEVTRLATLESLSEDTMTATVDLAGERFELPVQPGKYVPGALVAVLESQGKPRRVTGAAGVWPEGLDEDASPPAPVDAVVDLAPAEFSPEDQAKVDQAVADLGEAQQAIKDANDRIGALATTVGFAWSGSFEETSGSLARVVWTALGDGKVRFQMVDIPVGADVSWGFTFPGKPAENYSTNPVIVEAVQPGTITILAFVNDGEIEFDEVLDVRPEMMDSGPLQSAIADAAHAAMLASRIAPRFTRDPIPADGDDRPIGAVWTKVNSEGEELAYWAWDGTTWVPQSLATTVIPYLDAAHIRTGTLDTDRLNVTEVWAQIATIGKIITAELIATGAVTAEALNVVHVDPATGYGWRADPEGLTFLDQDGNPSIVLRTDMENRISIAQDGIVVASISPDGDLVGQTVTANQSLLYRGVEMDTILAERARGPVVFTKMTGAAIVGTAPARLVMATIETPADRRAYKLTFGFHRQSASRMQITFRQSLGNTVSNANSIQNYWYIAKTADATADYVEIAHIIPDSIGAWGAGNTVTFGFFAESLTSGQTVTFDPTHGVTMLVEDIGPALEVRDSVPYVPASGGGGGQGSDTGTTKKTYNSAWNATGHRTYSYTTLTSTRAIQSLVQGYMGGANSRGHWFFPDAIRTAITGATVNSATLTITNQGTGEGRATVVLKVHGYATAPATFGTATAWTTITVTSGQEISIPIPSWILNGIRDGSIRGFSLDHGGSTSRSFYAFFSPQATVRANYTK